MIASPEPTGTLPLAGQVVVVTGRLTQYTRAQAEAEIRRLGGTVAGGVTGKTDYLIAGEDAGSKLAKAQTLGIQILSEDDFRRLGAGEPAPAAASAPAASAASASAASPPTRPAPRDKIAAAPPAKRVSAAPKRDPEEWAHALDRARELVRAWLDRDGSRHIYGQRPGDTAEGRAILDAPPLLQVAAIHAALDAAKAPDPVPGINPAPAAQEGWQRRWKARDLLGALLRRKQPLTDEDIETLVGVLAAAPNPWSYAVPTTEILRGLALVTTPDRWTPAQRAALQRLLDGVPNTYAARGERLKLTRLLRGLLGLPEVDEAEAAPAPELPPQLVTDPEALRREAIEYIDTYLRGITAHPEIRREILDPVEYPAGRHLVEADAPLQLAAWEVGIQRLLEVAGQQRWSMEQRLLNEGLGKLLAQVPDQSLAAITADVAGVLERLPEAPGLWEHFWQVRAPLTRLLQRIEEDGLTQALRPQLRALRDRATPHAGNIGGRDLLVQLDRLLSDGRLTPVEAVDDWGHAARAALDALDEPRRAVWVRLLVYARDGSGSKPSARWLAGACPLIESLGADAHLDLTAAWLDLLKDEAPVPEQLPRETYSYTHSAVLSETNAAILRGLAWLSTLGETRRIAPQLAAAAIRCYQKVPGTGPRAVAVGNACLFALGTLDPLESIHHFQAVRHRVTYLPALRLIDAALEQAARQVGMSKEDLEDLTVPTFGLEDGRRREELGQYTAELVVEPGSVELRWSKAGAPLRTEPAAARREFPDEVKALKATAEEIRRHLPIQRKRLEWALMVGRTWSLTDWRDRCLDHPLVSLLARRLIWCFEGPIVQVGAWDGHHLVDAEDRPLGPLPAETRVRLWHPIGWEPAQVLAWRVWLERYQITQPFKQAHREVYVLTDAEVRTRTYSNRFAAHILRQHQMHALAQQRGWKAPLAMIYDGGWDTQLTLALPTWGLEAAYFVEGVLDDTNWEAGYNDNGVCLFVSTDQVRFHRAGESEPLPLTEVPALAFSEVMRDVDLFVGVASVGGDPAWHDRGNDQQRAYWQRYAFGDLSEAARTRREVLERLLPRLAKLAGRWQLTDRFLVVRGDLRTYKIHLGSGNILMESNDQYLCIVPDRRAAPRAATQGVFLPFEGDSTLAVVLSKALLLVEDTKITDPTITHQIGREVS